MHQTWKLTLLALVVAALGAADADARELMWYFQDTDFSTAPYATSAVALRSNQAWPVIFSGSQAYGLFATPGQQASYWHHLGTAELNGAPIAKSSVDGRILAYGSDPFDGHVLVGSPSGGFTSHNAQAGAFGPDGSLALATENTIPGGGDIIDMAVAPDGTRGFITEWGEYVEHRAGQWGYIDMYDIMDGTEPEGMRLTFDAQNRPHLAGVDGGSVFTASFSTAAGQWEVNHHGFTNAYSVPIASTSIGDGEVGIAWVDDGGSDTSLRYALFNGSEWISSEVTAGGLHPNQMVGLDFDWEGLPVISYAKEGNHWLAYDPIPVPEPSTLAMLGMGGLLLVRRRAA